MPRSSGIKGFCCYARLLVLESTLGQILRLFCHSHEGLDGNRVILVSVLVYDHR